MPTMTKEVKEQIEYYKSRYDEVHLVTCNKCNNHLAVEVRGGVDMAYDDTHPEGRVVIPLSYKDHPQKMALLSWRPRLDGQVGYLCGAMVDNPDYAEAEKSNNKQYELYLKNVEKDNKAAVANYEQRKKDYPKLVKKWEKTNAERKAGKTELDYPKPPAPTPPKLIEPMEKPDVNVDKFAYCLNDTRVADTEKMQIPVAFNGQAPPVMTPFDKEQLRISIRLSGRKPDIEYINERKVRVEKFTRERVK